MQRLIGMAIVTGPDTALIADGESLGKIPDGYLENRQIGAGRWLDFYRTNVRIFAGWFIGDFVAFFARG